MDYWLLMIDYWLLIIDCLQTENTKGNGGPQADFVGEQQLSAIRQQLKEVFIKLKQVTRISRELKEMGPQADCFGEQQLSALASAWWAPLSINNKRIIRQQLKEL